MSQIHAMSDDQVAGELKKMTAFIRQEALEKAKEIQIKADEEFAIEKSKLVRAETAAIDGQYEKKFKQAAMSQQITRSTVANKTRLRVLSARQELLDSLFETANKKLSEKSKDKAKYQKTLKNLLLEGMYEMNEPTVQVRARKADYESLKKAIEEAQKEYKQNTGKESKAAIDESNPLPEGSAGGLSVFGSNGKIEINNTFEERLRLLEEDALPSIRVTLFGENQNRKFHD
ncbi:ATPase, V1/A1 complex, subunit E [Saccharata proteae CBS 121410]|uniref:ATPase, V1/A1 complex, subunit E n=1 Tax=Saccharata proteae CBS 121410 TaxID=1314787 RepID=A0A9P4HNB0_9PEZI|nr:ATPase, V1/A1 complex, subunit E [Saccharata proteae CBS 121410]